MKNKPSSQVNWALPLGAREPGESLQTWLYRTLRRDIVDGRLPRAYVLPSTRQLAAQQGIARGTVQAAYHQLLSEGYLVASKGSGTRVSAVLPDDHLVHAADITAEHDVEVKKPKATSTWAGQLMENDPAFPITPQLFKRPFAPHTCDVTHFPVDTWRRLHMRHLGSVRPTVLLNRLPQGSPALRNAIAEHLAIARGVAASADHIVIVNSVQQALDICLRLVIEPGDPVWMEDPGYPGARQIIQGAGATIVDVPVDQSGLNVDQGIQLCKEAKLAYVTPCRQSPMGVALSADRKIALVTWARENGAYIFEDDYDSEYRFVAKPIPALKGLPHADHNVIMTGTFSKLLFPASGLAYVVLPPHLVEVFKRAMSLTNRGANALAQAALADFMIEGHFSRHIRRMRKIYAARAKSFEELAKHYLADYLEVPPILAGLDVVGKIKNIPELSLVDVFHEAGTHAFPLSRYTNSIIMPPGLVIGFAACNEGMIKEKLGLISRILHEKNPPKA